MNQADLQALEASVTALLQAFDEVCAENTALRNQQSNLISERAALIEKSELARSRVESMISRLKAMEIGQ